MFVDDGSEVGATGGGPADPPTASGAAPLPRALEPVVSAAEAFIEALTALKPSQLLDDELSGFLLALDRCRARVDAATTGLVGQWDARLAWAADGATSAAGWLAARGEQSRAQASAQVKVARALRRMPLTTEAFHAGQIGGAKARLLANAATRHPEGFAEDETWLVHWATRLSVAGTAAVIARWLAHRDDLAGEPTAEETAEKRRFHLSKMLDGTWRADGVLPAEDGEVVANALAAIGDELRAAHQATKDADARFTPPTAAQRRSDALTEMARRALGADPDTASPATPSLLALLDAHRLSDPDGVTGETDAGAPLVAEALRRLACDAGVARIIRDAGGRPLDLGVTVRTPSAAQRRALRARDRGCTFPGCDRPPGWCHAHHIVHWADGGPTALSNLALLCSHHHHLVHEGGYHLARGPDGELTVARPDHTPITARPAHGPITPRPG